MKPVKLVVIVAVAVVMLSSLTFYYIRNTSQSSELSWAYQLQNASIDEICNSGFKIFVMDYSYDGTQDDMYPKGEIERLKECGVVPIAYLSIGEAEDYRWYWNESWEYSPPDWLGEENPEWEGNYAVRYWDDEWKSIIFEYLDIIISQGFSGVYLDKVDEFEYWLDRGVEDAPHLMAEFIEELAMHARERNGDFIIVPQNGEEILNYEPELLSIVSGWAVEDLFYNGLERISEEEVEWRTEILDRVKEEGKFVLSVDYVDDGSGFRGENKERILDYISLAKKKGYVPYAALLDRDLDEINIISGIQPG